MVYEESQGGRGGGRVAAPNLAQLQLPFSSSVLRMCARGARCWAFSFSPSPSCSIPFSLSLSLCLFLSISLGLSFPTGSYARVLARTPPVPWRAPTLINAKLLQRGARTFARVSRDGDARLSLLISPILHRLINRINIRY